MAPRIELMIYVKNIQVFYRLSIISESKIGTAYARNRALAVSLSPITAFLDDDCIASSDWLKEIEKAHKRNPDVVSNSRIMQSHSFQRSTKLCLSN